MTLISLIAVLKYKIYVKLYIENESTSKLANDIV